MIPVFSVTVGFHVLALLLHHAAFSVLVLHVCQHMAAGECWTVNLSFSYFALSPILT
jgi:hypothetical protein